MRALICTALLVGLGCSAPSTFELTHDAAIADAVLDAAPDTTPGDASDAPDAADIAPDDRADVSTVDTGDNSDVADETDAGTPSDVAPDAAADTGEVDAVQPSDASDAADAQGDVAVDASGDAADVRDAAVADAAPDAGDSSGDATDGTVADAALDARIDAADAVAPDANDATVTTDVAADAGSDSVPDVYTPTPDERCRELTTCVECMAAHREPDGSGCGWCNATSRCLYGGETCTGGWLRTGSSCQ